MITSWSRYFLDAVIPIAEANDVKLALHPDDRPLSPLRGIGRILKSADSFRRVLNLRRSPINGITFRQANFSLMEESIVALAEEWCKENKIFFVHFRDVKGNRKHFIKTFHDNGPDDLAEMLRVRRMWLRRPNSPGSRACSAWRSERPTRVFNGR